MQPDDNVGRSDLDFSQLDQEINQLMQQKSVNEESQNDDSVIDESETEDTWSSISNQLKTEVAPDVKISETEAETEHEAESESKAEVVTEPEPETEHDAESTPQPAESEAEVKQDTSPVVRQKPRGYVMDVMHPSQSLARPRPTQKDLPVGDDYLISAKASPDKELVAKAEDKPKKVDSGYGSGGFSAQEVEKIGEKIDEAPTISEEKIAFEEEVNKFEDTPTEHEDNIDTKTDEIEDDITTEAVNGALPANNLVKQSTDSGLTDAKSSMFNTAEYVQPLKPPVKAKKSEEKFWVVLLIFLIIVLLGVGISYYLFILGR